MMQKDRIAIFAGSFNPFTIGHRSIVERGLEIFDRIVIAIGYHPDKPMQDAEQRVERIRKSFESEPRVEVELYTGLTGEYCMAKGGCAILRGVRGVADLEYERNLADANKKLLGIETVFLLSLPEYSYISSSLVRELAAHGKDITPLLG